MARSRTYFGLRRGSTRSHTFQVVRGQQITKDRVTDVANPKSFAQMVQRSRFGYITKFYSSGVKNFFKFAFEDKRPNESDYNAFMRNNVSLTPYATKEMLGSGSNPFFAPFIVTKGSLPPLEGELQFSDGDSNLILPGIEASSSDNLTVGFASQYFLESYPSLKEGDIITFVSIDAIRGYTPISSIEQAKNSLALVTNLGTSAVGANWTIIQFKINTSSTKTLESVGFDIIGGGDSFLPGFVSSSKVRGGILCASRPTDAGLKVSTSRVYLTDSCEIAYEIGISPAWGRFCSFNMGASDDALLKGALL